MSLNFLIMFLYTGTSYNRVRTSTFKLIRISKLQQRMWRRALLYIEQATGLINYLYLYLYKIHNAFREVLTFKIQKSGNNEAMFGSIGVLA